MSKLVMLSVIIMSIVAPVRMARDKNPARGLKKTVRFMTYFICGWALSLAYLYGRLF